jgi:hypothetical protein
MRKLRPLGIIVIAIVFLGLFPLGIYVYFEIKLGPEIRKITSDQAWLLYHVDPEILASEARRFAKEQRSLHPAAQLLRGLGYYAPRGGASGGHV